MRFLRTDPWLCTVAGLAIMITVLGFNLLGDGLRDRLDPRGLVRRDERSNHARDPGRRRCTSHRIAITNLADGGDAVLHLHEIAGGVGDGPTLGICGAIHGNEPTGTRIAMAIAERHAAGASAAAC